MAQTLTEKVLGRVMSRPVELGEVIYPEPDLVTVHDWYVLNFDQALADFGVQRLFDPSRVLICTDHEPVAVSPQAALRQRRVREVVAKYGITRFFDAGRGGHGHIFPMEMGIVRPGMFVFGYDVHVTNFGAVGCLAVPLVTEITEVLACGSAWIRVPETLRVEVTGTLADGVSVRDAAQALIHEVDEDLFDYAVVEFGGPGLSGLSVDQRMTLCNTPIEMGAKSTICEVDERAAAWVLQHSGASAGDARGLEMRSDPGARFRSVFVLDLARAAPCVAAPPTPDNVVPIGQLRGLRIDQAFIGSCASSSLSDLRDAARVLRHRKLAPHVRMIVTPGTEAVARAAAAEGLLEVFMAAGASISAPGCGPCAAGRIGGLAPGEVSINTGTRNDPGRLGPTDAAIYLASPFTVAASAVTGVITDPRELLDGRPAA